MQCTRIALCVSLWVISASAMEVEKKFAGISENTLDTLKRYALAKKTKHQVDQYFDTHDNALYQKGAYTRLRTEWNPEQSPTYTLCHKRIRDDEHGKQCRDEHEYPVHDATKTIGELHEQGLVEKARLRKERTQYTWPIEGLASFSIAIDSITFSDNTEPKTYAEIEYIGSTLSGPEALARIDTLANTLGLHTHETRSNLELAFNHAKQ